MFMVGKEIQTYLIININLGIINMDKMVIYHEESILRGGDSSHDNINFECSELVNAGQTWTTR